MLPLFELPEAKSAWRPELLTFETVTMKTGDAGGHESWFWKKKGVLLLRMWNCLKTGHARDVLVLSIFWPMFILLFVKYDLDLCCHSNYFQLFSCTDEKSQF